MPERCRCGNARHGHAMAGCYIGRPGCGHALRTLMSPSRFCLVVLATVLATTPLSARAGQPVLLISIDGLRPLEVLDKARGGDLPTLRQLARDGAHATRVHGVLPTL